MQLAAHSDACCLNQTKALSRTIVRACLSEDVPMPAFNGAALTAAQTAKRAASSVAEAELTSLFMTSKKRAALQQALKEMG